MSTTTDTFTISIDPTSEQHDAKVALLGLLRGLTVDVHYVDNFGPQVRTGSIAVVDDSYITFVDFNSGRVLTISTAATNRVVYL